MKFPAGILLALLSCLVAGSNSIAQSNTVWTLVWSDEFSQANGSSPDPAKWTNDVGAGGWGNSELEYYTSRTNNARIENGQLIIEARQESYLGSNYTSARLKTLGRASWRYGRLEARMKIPRTQGIWPAFWTLGTNISVVGWPNCGEIDIMENIGKEPTIVHGTAHGPGYSGGNGIGGPYSLPGNAAFADDFHIYAVEWTTNQLKWFVDGRQYFSANPASLPGGATWVFTKPQFLLLNVAVGGNWPGNPDGTTVFPQRLTVDYVRVYAPTLLAACGENALTNTGFETGGLAGWTPFGAGFNTLLENIQNVLVHDGTNVFKVFGQFTGTTNLSGVSQDLAASAGQSFTASAWMCTPGNDTIAGANAAWFEIFFRNAANQTLALYRTALVDANTPAGAWLKLTVTNQLDPVSLAVIGFVTNLVAPANTTSLRARAVFRQSANAAGSVLFDDLKLSPGGTSESAVPVSLGLSGNHLDLSFLAYLDLPYVIRWKTDLDAADWLVLTNFAGDGTIRTVPVQLQSASGFYRITRVCN